MKLQDRIVKVFKARASTVCFLAAITILTMIVSGCSDQNADFIADVMFGEKDVSISVDSPAGGAVLKRGTQIAITWTAIPKFDTIDILIIHGNGVAATVVTQYPDYRRFEYVLPLSLAVSYDYQVRIVGHREDYSVVAESERFRVY